MEPGDLELVTRLRRGDRSAFEALYLRHKDRMYRHALIQTAGRAAIAEEVVQDVFLSLFDGSSRPRQHVGAYLLTAIRNRARNALSRRELRGDQVEPEAAAALLVACPAGASPEDAARQREEASLLAEALCALDPEQRQVVLLRTWEGLAWKEVAELCGAPLPTVSSRYRAALEQLRHHCRSLSHA